MRLATPALNRFSTDFEKLSTGCNGEVPTDLAGLCLLFAIVVYCVQLPA